MHISAPINVMKVNDLVNGNPSTPDMIPTAEAEAIGQAFTREFYTSLSDNRDVQKYYGHSSVTHFDGKTVIGQKEISSFYEGSIPQRPRVKITSINGIPTKHNGILVQVVGTINQRQFTQIFILGQQCLKKYYVESDMFQFIGPKQDARVEQKINGHAVNGKPSQTVESPPQVATARTPQKPQQTPTKAQEYSSPKPVQKSVEKTPEPVRVSPVKASAAPAPPTPKAPAQTAPAPAPVPQEPSKPKTWANLFGNDAAKASATASQQPPVQQQPQQQAPKHQPAQTQVPRDTHPQTQNANTNEIGNVMERKIFLGGIIRSMVPDSVATAETEIRSLFYQFGEVEDVFIPKKVLDSPNDTRKPAFAFVTMRNLAATQKVFDAATKDEQGNYHLPLKIESFGFEGVTTISSQKDKPHPPFGGYRSRGGFQQRGGYNSRGGSRGGSYGGRGGSRGGFQSNPVNGSH